MAKLQDKLYNRIIEGALELSDEEKQELLNSGIYKVSGSIDDVKFADIKDFNVIEYSNAYYYRATTNDVDNDAYFINIYGNDDSNDLSIDILFVDESTTAQYVYYLLSKDSYLNADNLIATNEGGESMIGYFQDDGSIAYLSASSQDAGKVLGVNAEGEPVLVEVSGGTKFYKHHLIIDGTAGFDYPITVDLITSTSTPLSKDTPINLNPGFDFVSGYLVDNMDSPSVLFSFSILSNSRFSIDGISTESQQIISNIGTMTSLTDTVTPL